MKSYLITTGIIFGLIAVMHLMKSISDLPNFGKDPGGYISMAALGGLAAALSIWAWRLLALRSANKPKDGSV